MLKHFTTRLKSIQPIDFIFLAVLVFVSAGFSILYISSERYFYYWDYSVYQAMAARVAREFLQSPALMLKDVRNSINLEYNYYYTLPLIPFLIKSNTSRLAYILGITLVYQAPYALVLGAIATRLIQAPARAVFWSTALLAFLTPMALAPTLRGYPDVAAALMIALAVWIYLIDIHLKPRWQPVLIGVCLAAAMLLRRHYIYAAAAFILASGLLQLVLFFLSVRKDRRNALRELFVFGLNLGLILAVLLLALMIFGRPYLTRLLASDYRALYQSYANPPVAALKMFISYYGWITLGLAVLGLALGLRKGVLNRNSSLFLIFMSLASWMAWVIVIRYYATHYTLHLTYGIVLGISALFWTAWLGPSGFKRWLAVAALSTLVIANAILHLAPVGPLSNFSGLFPMRYAPLVRQDYAEVERLVAYLRKHVATGAAIFMVDSSIVMNDDLLANADKAVDGQPILNVMHTPQVDSRDFYPLEQLLQAQYVLVSTPYQHVLKDPDQQRVSGVVFNAFQDGWEIAQDFELVPRQFKFANGAVLKIYQRIRPTSLETAVRTFHEMLAYIDRRPGQQKDWIVLHRLDGLQWTKTADSAYHLEFEIGNHDTISQAVSLLYADQLSGRLTVALDASSLIQACPSARLVLQTFDPAGNLISSQDLDFAGSSPTGQVSLQFDAPGLQYLVLSLDLPAGESCAASLDWKIDR